MARTPRLTDLQLILLSHAGAKDHGHLFPLPPAAVSAAERIEPELKSLLRRELVVEAPAPSKAATWRMEADQRVGLVLTDKGRAAIGIDSSSDEPDTSAVAGDDAAPPRVSKQAAVIALLTQPEGATLAEIMALTGWLAHSTRAALTGLRKKGHIIERSKPEGETCYRIDGPA